jgi:hypothetical protein
MVKVVIEATMSLDGFVADPSDQFGLPFDWYGNGDIEVAPGDPERVFRVSAASAGYLTVPGYAVRLRHRRRVQRDRAGENLCRSTRCLGHRG